MELDIVIPAYNEENRIGRTLTAYRQTCTGGDVRFHVALDRSEDATADIVREHASQDPRVQLHEYPRLGKGGAIMETFRRCDAQLIGFVDADGATPPAEFLRLVEAARAAGGAIASRWHPSSFLPAARPPLRQLTSAGFALGIRRLFRLPYLDTQCGAKVLRREAVQRAAPLLSARDFLFDVDLLLTVRELGYDVVEVPTVWVDQEGSRLAAGADGRQMAISALRLWLHHRVMPVNRVAKQYRPADRRMDEEDRRVAA